MKPTFGVSIWHWTSLFTIELAHTLLPKIKQMGYQVVETPVEYPELIDGPWLKEVLAHYSLHMVIAESLALPVTLPTTTQRYS